MSNKKKTEDKGIVESSQKTPSIILEGDPEKQLAYAQKASKALMSVVDQKPKKVIINGKRYLEFGDWQVLARFYGATAGIEWSKPYGDKASGDEGFEAHAVVMRGGEIIASADAICTRAERNWKTRDEFALKSMAQTRACAKALRNAFGWVAELAGYASTPAEEMDYDTTPIKVDAVPVVTYDEDMVPAPKKVEKSVSDETKKKSEIKKLCDVTAKSFEIVLKTKKDYEEYVEGNTGLKLEPENYDTIIERLTSLQ